MSSKVLRKIPSYFCNLALDIHMLYVIVDIEQIKPPIMHMGPERTLEKEE